MLFLYFRCPKCGLKEFFPDFDLTIESYIENDYRNDAMLILEELPTVRPNYLIFKCIDIVDCKHVEKYTEEYILKKIIEGWSNIAWSRSQQEIKDAYSFENHFTRYLLEGGKQPTEQDLKNNPILQKYVNNAKTKSIKKINT